MQYWIQPRYTATPELMKWLFFHDGQVRRGLPDRIQAGDRVLFYRTKWRKGGQAIVGSATVLEGKLEEVSDMSARHRGKYDWRWQRRVRCDVALPEDAQHRGVPLATVLDVLGWKPTARIRQLIPVSQDRFHRLEGMLKRISGEP